MNGARVTCDRVAVGVLCRDRDDGRGSRRDRGWADDGETSERGRADGDAVAGAIDAADGAVGGSDRLDARRFQGHGE